MTVSVNAEKTSPFGRFIQNATGATTRTVQRKLEEFKSIKDFGAVCDGATDDLAAINLGIDWMIASAGRRLVFPHGLVGISGPWNTLTGNDFGIIGNSTRLVMLSSASDNGSVITVGSAAANAARFYIGGFTITYDNTPDVDDYFIDMVRGGDGIIENMCILNAPGVLRIGGEETVTRMVYRNFTGNANKSVDGTSVCEAIVDVRDCSSQRFYDFHINAPGDGAAGANSADKACMRIAPVTSTGIDTIYMERVSISAFSTTSPVASADGRGYGLLIDRTAADITNIWSEKQNHDHTTVAAVLFTDSEGGSSSGFSRNMNLRNGRYGTDRGDGIVVDLTGASSALLVRGLQIFGNTVSVGSNSNCLRVKDGRTRIRGGDYSHNVFLDTDFGTAKDYAVLLDTNNFKAIGNSIDGASSSTGWSNAFRIDNAGCNDFLIEGNYSKATTFISNASTSSNYKVSGNVHQDSLDVESAATITLSAEGEFFNITGTTDITSVTASWKGRRVTLRFASTLNFTDGSNLKLASTLATTADDTITIVCHSDGNWYEVARSVN